MTSASIASTAPQSGPTWCAADCHHNAHNAADVDQNQPQVAQSEAAPAGRQRQAAGAIDGIQDRGPQGVGPARPDTVDGDQQQSGRCHDAAAAEIDHAVAAATQTRQEFGDGGQDEEQAGQCRPALRTDHELQQFHAVRVRVGGRSVCRSTGRTR